MVHASARPLPLLAAVRPALATAGTLVERDAQGRRTGTVETHPDGGAVLRDAQGRRTGTSERSGDKLIRRDSQGRLVGTVERAH